VFENGTPDKAVDGVTEHSGRGGVCAHTEQGNVTDRAWWTVDLGDEYRVTGIKIFNRNQQRKFKDDYSSNVILSYCTFACFASHRHDMKCSYCNRRCGGVTGVVMKLKTDTIINCRQSVSQLGYQHNYLFSIITVTF